MNSYLIKRNNSNQRLLLDLPNYSNHSYWFLVDKQLDILQLMNREINEKELFTLVYIKQDDLPSTNKKYMDISHLKSGRYYLYYSMSIYPPKYEAEIILKDIID